MKTVHIAFVFVLLTGGFVVSPAAESTGFLPGQRSLFEAHNCYPYRGLWNNRIDKALDAGFPLAIEIDVMWHAADEEGPGRLVVAHNEPLTGDEPTLEAYFFERVRPYVERALKDAAKTDWPIITLNINDIRSNRAEPFEEVLRLAEKYDSWFCAAIKGATPQPAAPIEVKPILALAGGGRLETQHFYDAVPEGGRLRIFGSGNPNTPADNFRRWINYSWSAVEPEGQNRATEWNEEKETQLRTLTQNAHEQGYWIRFYSLNGHPAAAGARLGLSPGYNFGSLDTVKIRWAAAFKAGVDFIATDQIGDAKKFISTMDK
ncbi:MAG TPA: hypothetical protein ENN29_00065 [Candidatus Hydrogenedentes bacterium]|nr:hypothetical protein [Candidatus Hydrogenedentota bacterium]